VTPSLTVTSPAQLGPTANSASPRIHSRMSHFTHRRRRFVESAALVLSLIEWLHQSTRGFAMHGARSGR
jgi:hypothetical protein